MTFFRNDPEIPLYIPPRANERQLGVLERIISLSPDASEFAKAITVWVLRQTEHLTRNVALSLPEDGVYGPKLAEEMQNGAHGMNSVNGHTHLSQAFDLIDTEVVLSHHCGGFKSGRFDFSAPARTIWISYVFYDFAAHILSPPDPAELAKVILPGWRDDTKHQTFSRSWAPAKAIA
jgi:hypothetical protein